MVIARTLLKLAYQVPAAEKRLKFGMMFKYSETFQPA
jgi:hypothetical protein